MGQYYKPIILKDNGKDIEAFVHPHTLDNGLKLMEHAYMGNSVPNSVVNYLKEHGAHKIVWAGDYAEARNGDEDNLYSQCPEGKELKTPKTERDWNIRFLINEDKKEYLDLERVVSLDAWTIHPLPLLTADGNGQGGGDYYGTDMDFVGSWAYDTISVSEKYPPIDYKRIEPLFLELGDITRGLAVVAKALERLPIDIADDEWFKKNILESVAKIDKVKEW